MWSSEEAARLLVYIVFCYWQPTSMNMNLSKTWYDSKRKHLSCSFPSGIFGIIWALLFGLIATSGFLYLGQPDSGDSKYFVPVFAIYAFNVVLTKVWYPIFFGKTTARMGLALFIALLISATAIVVLVLMALDQSYLALGLYCPYIAWSLYALYLNYRFWKMPNNEVEKRKEHSKRFISTAKRRESPKLKVIL